jgi:hypothetical protein
MVLDVNIGNWSKDIDKKETVRKSTYIKYLGMPIGETEMSVWETLTDLFSTNHVFCVQDPKRQNVTWRRDALNAISTRRSQS